ncbi:PEGA domain-containing protein [Persicimonas caeni]|nr:PEGA domain-containing protein [Persicimonas caeni]
MSALTRRLCTVVLAGVLLGAGASSAFAQDVSKEELERFQAHLDKGGRLLEKKQYEDAIIELKRARRIIDHPKISLSIAGAYGKWGRCAKARKEYSALLGRKKVDEEILDKASAGIEGLDTCVDTGTLAVSCSPEHAQVSIDGGEAMACPVRTDLKVGSHKLEVSAGGFKATSETAEIEPDQTTKVSVSLSPITVKRQKDKTVEAPADVEPARPEWQTWASWGGIGLGGALLGAGLVNDAMSVGRADDIAAAQNAGNLTRARQLEADADAAYTRSVIFYSSGAVFLATGLTLQFVDFETDAGATTSVGFTATGISTRVDW